jgi:four helix bundle protein
VRDFQQVAAWQKAHQLTLEVYKTVESFPTSQKYELSKQLTRATSSIGANIAEGCGRGGDPELRHFLRIAIGSGFEVENHLLLAKDIGFLPPDDHQRLEQNIHEVQRMLASFIRKIESDLQK